MGWTEGPGLGLLAVEHGLGSHQRVGCRGKAAVSDHLGDDLDDLLARGAAVAGGLDMQLELRRTVGDIVAGGGTPFVTALYDGIGLIVGANGHALWAPAVERARTTLTAAGSPFNSSMARDLEGGHRVEADHVIGDLLKRAKGGDYPMLAVAYAHLKAYEVRRKREGKG